MNLHAFVVTNRAALLERCRGRLRAQHSQRPDEVLLATLPVFLDEVIEALARDMPGGEVADRATRTESRPTARGGRRRATGFGVASIVRDHALLRDAVNDLAAERHETFTARESRILSHVVDEQIARAIEAFVASADGGSEKGCTEELGFLAHEIRNAVGSARMAFALIQRGQVGLSGRTAEVLERSLARIDTLVTQTLADVRMRANAPLRWSNVGLVDLVDELTGALCPERGVRVQAEVSEGASIVADRALLLSAVNNLLQNAIKFTVSGGVVSFRVFASAYGSVKIEVEDRCGGLPSGAAATIFEPFAQGGQDRRGAGLGLTIVRRAVAAHGGTIGVRNLPGVGCIFTIDLPQGARAAA